MKSGNFLTSCILLAAVFIAGSISVSQTATALVSPAKIVAASAESCNKGGFFGLEPWYHFLPDNPPNSEFDANCGIKCFNVLPQTTKNDCGLKNSDIPGVILAIVDDLLQIAGIVAVVFVIVGAFQYVGSRGNAERTASAQSTITAALTGLAITLVAVGFVSFIGNSLQ